MIVDISNEILTKLKTDITTATVTTSYPDGKLTKPNITFREIANTTDSISVDSSGERYNEVSFEINIFTFGNKKQSDALKLRQSVDVIMSGEYGMNRSFSDEVPNFLNAEIFRYIIRYDCLIDSNKVIYRR
jgi:hypothetical protein